MSGKIEALLRGAGQGASLGWGDEFGSLLTPEAHDDTGIPRTYAAGSAYNDLRDNARAENAESQAKYPAIYGSGQALGALPSTVAMGGSSIPTVGLMQGARGAIEGAGMGTEGNRLSSGAKGAGTAAALGMAGAAAPKILSLFKGGPPSSGLTPAFATAGAAPARAAPALGGPILNEASALTEPVRARAGRVAPSPAPSPSPARPVQEPVVPEIPENLHASERQAMLPGASDEATASLPKPPNPPLEYSGKYEPDFGPTDLMEGETKGQFLKRVLNEQQKQNAARGLKSVRPDANEFNLKPGKGMTVKQTHKTPTGVEEESVSVERGKPTDIKRLMKKKLDDKV